MKYYRRSIARRRNGVVTSAILLMVLFVSVIIGFATIDIAHGFMFQRQLQSATDAGALAGASQLLGTVLPAAAAERAQQFAETVTGSNTADSASVSSDTPGTNVNVTVNSQSTPHTVTVDASAGMNTLYAKYVGFRNVSLSAHSVAGCFQGLRSVNPNQVLNLAISIDIKPEKGPMKGRSLNSAGPGSLITIVTGPKNQQNAQWDNHWEGIQNQTITFDQTSTGSGGNPSYQSAQPGSLVAIPITQGTQAPFTKNIIGTMGFRVKKIVPPNQIIGTIVTPIILTGQPGMVMPGSTTPADNAFLMKTMPWKVMLLQ